MKNQYVADINDYRKYGLLRILAGECSLGVWWMRTLDDGGGDGQKLAYLADPARWRHHDPALFDGLARIIAGGGRGVARVESSGLVPARFFAEITPDDRAERVEHFARAAGALAGADLVFVDPDNGLEVGSVSYGGRRSGKYLFWHEAAALSARGQSLLIYQHFPRRERSAYLRELGVAMLDRLGVPEAVVFRTPHVAFLLAIQARHADGLRRAARVVRARWAGQIDAPITVVERMAA